MPFQVVRQIFFRGEMLERIIEVPGDVLRIGRGVSNDLPLEDLSVSLNHATITRDEQGSYHIQEVTPIGAIYVNRAPIKDHVLRHGDTIRIQHYLLAVSQDDSSGSLVLTVKEEPRAKIESSLALMPKFKLGGGQWTKGSIAIVLCCLVVLGSVVAYAVGQRSVFMPGGVSMKHAKFANQCQACHVSAKYVWDLVPNDACQGCHEPKILSPAHFRDHVALTPSPLCASCHLEHKGQRLLADVQDQKCVQCHGDLKAANQQVANLAPVHSFMTDHPEFAVVRSLPDGSGPLRVRLDDKALLKDESTLKVNHQRHVELDADYLATEFGVEKRRMYCADCHRMDDTGQTMLPIRFERDCQRCHMKELEFDSMMPGRRVTHGKQLDAVWQQLEEIFAGAYMQAHPEEAKKPLETRWIPGRRLPALPQTPQKQYMVDRLVEAEKLLLSLKSRRCLKCHETEPVGQATRVKAAAGGVPGNTNLDGSESGVENGEKAGRADQLLDKTRMVAQTGAFSIRIRNVTALYRDQRGGWMPYSRFDHQAHASLPELEVKGGQIRNDRPNENRTEKKHENWCVACHEQAPRSMKTEDVLLPSIGVCRQCHTEPGGAQASCKSCHDFHVPKSPLLAVGGEFGTPKVVTP